MRTVENEQHQASEWVDVFFQLKDRQVILVTQSIALFSSKIQNITAPTHVVIVVAILSTQISSQFTTYYTQCTQDICENGSNKTNQNHHATNVVDDSLTRAMGEILLWNEILWWGRLCRGMWSEIQWWNFKYLISWFQKTNNNKFPSFRCHFTQSWNQRKSHIKGRK